MDNKYNTILDKIEKEISNILPKESDKKWLNSAVGGLDTDIDTLSADYINKPAYELIYRGGKRWRPMVLVLTAKSLSNSFENAFKLSPLVELIHNGTLLIDDIEDKAIERRGKKAIHLIYGDDMAINSGNHLYFLPTVIIDNLNLDPSLKLRIYESYASNMRRLHFGQGLDIQWHNNLNKIPSVKEYMQMCKFKTGCLASMSGELGGIIAGSDKEITEKIRVIWENIGVAFQILDDIKNITTGNPGKLRGDDIVEGKKSLPVILFCNENNNKELLKNIAKAKHKGIIKGRRFIERAITILEDSGSIKKGNTIAQELLKKSLADFDKLYPQNNEKIMLREIVQKFVD